MSACDSTSVVLSPRPDPSCCESSEIALLAFTEWRCAVAILTSPRLWCRGAYHCALAAVSGVTEATPLGATINKAASFRLLAPLTTLSVNQRLVKNYDESGQSCPIRLSGSKHLQQTDRRLHRQHLSLRLSVRADKCPFCARIAPQLSVLSSKLAARLPVTVHRVPVIQLALAAVPRRELDMLFRAHRRGGFVAGRGAQDVTLSLRMVTWSPCAESCSTPAIYGRSGLPSSKPIATSVPAQQRQVQAVSVPAYSTDGPTGSRTRFPARRSNSIFTR